MSACQKKTGATDPRTPFPERMAWLTAALVVAIGFAVWGRFLLGAEQDARPELWIYTAKWCGPCRKLHAEVDRKPSRFDEFNVHWIDVDEHPELPEISIPQIRWWKADGKTPGGVKGWGTGSFETFYAKWRKDTQR